MASGPFAITWRCAPRSKREARKQGSKQRQLASVDDEDDAVVGADDHGVMIGPVSDGIEDVVLPRQWMSTRPGEQLTDVRKIHDLWGHATKSHPDKACDEASDTALDA